MRFAGNNDGTIEIPAIGTATVRPACTSGRTSVLPAHLQFHLLPVGEKDDARQSYDYGTPPSLFGWLKVPTFATSLVIFLCGLALVFQIGWHTGSAPSYDAAEGNRPSQSQEATAPSPDVTTSSKPNNKPGMIQPVAITEEKPTPSRSTSPTPTPTPTTQTTPATPSSSPSTTATTSEPPVATTTPEPTTTSQPLVVPTDKPTATSVPPETPEATASPSGTTVP